MLDFYFKHHRETMRKLLGPISSLEILIRENPHMDIRRTSCSLSRTIYGPYPWAEKFSDYLRERSIGNEELRMYLHNHPVSFCSEESNSFDRNIELMFEIEDKLNIQFGIDRHNVWRFVDVVKNLSRSFELSLEIVKKNLKQEWSWHTLSASPCISMSDIEENLELPWDWAFVAMNPNITFQFIRKHKDKLKWNMLITNMFRTQNTLNLIKFRFPKIPCELIDMLLQYMGPVRKESIKHRYGFNTLRKQLPRG